MPSPLQLELGLFGHQRQLVEVYEAARALQVSEQQIRDLIDRGELLVVPINDQPNPKREHVRVQRFTVEAWYLERSAHRNGIAIPYRETPEVTWWRQELRNRWTTPQSQIRNPQSAIRNPQ